MLFGNSNVITFILFSLRTFLTVDISSSVASLNSNFTICIIKFKVYNEIYCSKESRLQYQEGSEFKFICSETTCFTRQFENRNKQRPNERRKTKYLIPS